MVPRQPGALVHGVIVGRRALRRVRPGDIHETGANHPLGVKPLEGGAIAEPRG